jgi:hypothetical protein
MTLSNPYGTTGSAATEYSKSLLALVGTRDPLAVQAELLPFVQGVAHDVAPAHLREPERPGKWSIAQVIQHLADTELVYGYRARMILTHDTPAIQPYDQDLWSERLHYNDVDLDRALEQLSILRGVNHALYRRLSPRELDRHGIHGERGAESVRLMLALIAGHDLVHRRQIDRIRAAVAR